MRYKGTKARQSERLIVSFLECLFCAVKQQCGRDAETICFATPIINSLIARIFLGKKQPKQRPKVADRDRKETIMRSSESTTALNK